MKFSVCPELSVSNIEISKRFYLQIGFHIVYERKEDKFAFLELEGNQLMIEEINDHWSTGCRVSFWTGHQHQYDYR